MGRSTSDPRWVRAAGLTSREVDGGFVVLDAESGTGHALEGDAAAVWRALDGGPEPDLSARARDAAIDSLAGLGLIEAPGLTRRTLLARGGILAAGVGITSMALPMADAAASTLVTKLITANGTTSNDSGTYTIPANARRVSIVLTGAQGGTGASAAANGGSTDGPSPGGGGGRIAWPPTGTFDLAATGLVLTYNLGNSGGNGTESTAGAGAGAAGTYGGTTATMSGGVGGNAAPAGGHGGGGGGGASKLVVTGAASVTLIAGGGGGGGGHVKDAYGGAVDGTGAGGAGTAGTGSDSGFSGATGGTGGGPAGGTGGVGGAGTDGVSPRRGTTLSDGGGGGGGGGNPGGGGSNGQLNSGGGGAGSSAIGTFTGSMTAPGYGATASGPGTLSITYYTVP